MVWDFRPAVLENGAAEFVEFALEGDVEASALQTKIESANPAEKRGGTKARLRGGAFPHAVLLRRSVGFSVGLL